MVDMRFVDKLAIALALSGLALTGCSSDSMGSNGGLGTTPPLTGVPNNNVGIAGATVPAAVPKQPVGSGGPAVGSSGTAAAPVRSGSGGTPSVVMMPPLGAAGTTATPMGAAGMMVSSVDGWTPQANLDANGVLIKPVAGGGYQMETTTFALQPGQEVYACFHVATPNDADFAVGEWDGQMSKGSHHFILYRDAGDSVASGTLAMQGCTLGFGGSTWLYTQGTPRSHLTMPDGVAMVIKAHERIVFDLHYINTTTAAIQVKVTLNMNKVKAEKYQIAGSQVSFNFGISVPAHGMQTVSGNCPPVAGANYFIMQTHTHKHATDALVTRKLMGGAKGEELVHTTDWDNPQAHEWHAAPFLTFKQGESFDYSCTYKNDTDLPVTVGTSAEVNEMCMAEAYYFPASGNPPGCT